MSPSTRLNFATSGRPCGDPIHGTGLGADIERELCKEPKVTKLARDGSTYLIHTSNAGIRGGGRVDATSHKPASRTSSMSANAGSPLKTVQLALPELDAAARTSPTEGKENTLKIPKDAVFPFADSSTNNTSAPKTSGPKKKSEKSLDSIIDTHLARNGYGNRATMTQCLDQERSATVVHYPLTSTNYSAKQETKPAALWANNEAVRSQQRGSVKSKESKASKVRGIEGAKIEEDWCDVGTEEEEEEWTMV